MLPTLCDRDCVLTFYPTDEIYNAPHPPSYSRKFQQVAVKGDDEIVGVVEDK